MPSKDKEQASAGYDQRQDVQALRVEVQRLRQMVRNVAEANAVENVILNGFSTLATQLEPLRALGGIAPQRMLLRQTPSKALADVRAGLARPKWRNASFEIDKPDQPAESNQLRSM